MHLPAGKENQEVKETYNDKEDKKRENAKEKGCNANKHKEPVPSLGLNARYLESSVPADSASVKNGEGELDAERREFQWWEIVTAYLCAKFHPRLVPPFEKDSYTLSVLQEIFQADIEALLLKQMRDDGVSKIEKEWEVQGKRLDSIAESRRIPIQSLSKTAQKHLTLLGDIAVQLGLIDGRMTSYYKAIGKLQQDHQKLVDVEMHHYKALVEKLNNHKLYLSTEHGKLKSFANELKERMDEDQQSIQEYDRNSSLLTHKKVEYSKRLETLQNTYWSSSLHKEELRYHQLHELQHQVTELKEECSNKRKNLEGYKDLPPDLTLTKLKVEETRVKLAELQQQREELLTDMVKIV